MRAIRGATTAPADDRDAILDATRELLTSMLEANGLELRDVVCAFFSGTADLTRAFPAAAARSLGWDTVPLFGSQEMSVQGAPPRCIRVMLLTGGDSQECRPNHLYLRDAASLRPDLVHSPDHGNSDSALSSGFSTEALFSPVSPYQYYFLHH